jgi:hypothetical protein
MPEASLRFRFAGPRRPASVPAEIAIGGTTHPERRAAARRQGGAEYRSERAQMPVSEERSRQRGMRVADRRS